MGTSEQKVKTAFPEEETPFGNAGPEVRKFAV
jgi:hypothetical protein